MRRRRSLAALVVFLLLAALGGAGLWIVLDSEAGDAPESEPDLAPAPQADPVPEPESQPEFERTKRFPGRAAAEESAPDEPPAGGGRRVSWRVVAGSAPVPADGTRITLRSWAGQELPDGRMEAGRLEASGLPNRHGVLAATTPDGAVARPFLPAPRGEGEFLSASGDEGPEFSFRRAGVVRLTARDESGAPVADMRIGTGSHGMDADGPSAVTDAFGRAEIRGVYEEAIGLWAVDAASRHGYLVRAVRPTPEGIDVDVVVPRVRDVTLRLLVDGEPFVPAEFTLYAEVFQPRDPEIDRASGTIRFRVRPMQPSRPLRITFGSQGFETFLGEAQASGVDRAYELEIALKRVSAVQVRGRIIGTWDEGWPVALDRLREADGAWVWMADRPPLDGKVWFVGLHPGTYRLRDPRGGIVSETVAASADGRETVATLDVESAAHVNGRVDLPSGVGVRSVRLLVEGDGVGWAWGRDGKPGLAPMDDGNYRLRLPSNRRVRISVWNASYGAGVSADTVEASAPAKDVLIGLSDRGVLTFRPAPTPPDGQAIGVTATPLGKKDTRGPQSRVAIVSGGVARLAGLDPGPYSLWIDHRDTAPVTVAQVDVSLGTVDVGEVRFPAGSSVRVRILVAPGRDVPNVSASVGALDPPTYFRGPVYAAGRDEIVVRGLGPGRFEVVLQSITFTERRRISLDGSTTEEIELDLR